MLSGTGLPTSVFSRPRYLILLATLCCLLWGSAYPAIKGGYALLGIARSDTAAQLVFAGDRLVGGAAAPGAAGQGPADAQEIAQDSVVGPRAVRHQRARFIRTSRTVWLWLFMTREWVWTKPLR